MDVALARAGRPPRRVWVVFSSIGEYADKQTFSPAFASHDDAFKFMERLAHDLDWEAWVWSDESGEFHACGDRNRGLMRTEIMELVPVGGSALRPCPWRHGRDNGLCAKPDGHP